MTTPCVSCHLQCEVDDEQLARRKLHSEILICGPCLELVKDQSFMTAPGKPTGFTHYFSIPWQAYRFLQ